MNISQLESFSLTESAKFKDQLNPQIWNRHEHLKNAVKDVIMVGVEEYCQYLGLREDQIKDIVVAGKNAGYLYEGKQAIEVVVIADINPDPTFRELFNEQGYRYNGQHPVQIGDQYVKFYVQPSDEEFVSRGNYSVLRECWNQVAQRKPEQPHDTVALLRKAEYANTPKLKPVRAVKVIKERKPVVYGYGADYLTDDVTVTPDGVSATTREFASEDQQVSNEDILKDFIDFCAKELKLKDMPVIKLRKDPQWSVVNKTFGRYMDGKKMLEVAWGKRHLADILRTIAHELTHKHQHERDGEKMGMDAGETGSPWENEANARAGILMRDYGRMHPEIFLRAPTT